MAGIYDLENSPYKSIQNDVLQLISPHKQANNVHSKDIAHQDASSRSRPEVMYVLAGFSVSLPLVGLLILYIYYKGYCKRRKKQQRRLETSPSFHEINRISMYVGDQLEACPVVVENGDVEKSSDFNLCNGRYETVSLTTSENAIQNGIQATLLTYPTNNFNDTSNDTASETKVEETCDEPQDAREAVSMETLERVKASSMNCNGMVTSTDDSLNSTKVSLESDVITQLSSIVQQIEIDRMEGSEEVGCGPLSEYEPVLDTQQVDDQIYINILQEKSLPSSQQNPDLTMEGEKSNFECSPVIETNIKPTDNETTESREQHLDSESVESGSESTYEMINSLQTQDVDDEMTCIISADDDHYVAMTSQKPVTDDDHYITMTSQKPITDDDHYVAMMPQKPITDDDHYVTMTSQKSVTDDDHHLTMTSQMPTTDDEHYVTMTSLKPITDDEHYVTMTSQKPIKDDDNYVTMTSQKPITDDDHYVTMTSQKSIVADDHYITMTSQKSIEEDRAAILHHYVTINAQNLPTGEYKVETEHTSGDEEYMDMTSHTILNPQLSLLEDYVTMYPYGTQVSDDTVFHEENDSDDDYEVMDGGPMTEHDDPSRDINNQSSDRLSRFESIINRLEESPILSTASCSDHNRNDQGKNTSGTSFVNGSQCEEKISTNID